MTAQPPLPQVWEGHIVSASLDGLMKIWEPADPASGLVVNPQPVFSYPEQVGAQGDGLVPYATVDRKQSRSSRQASCTRLSA